MAQYIGLVRHGITDWNAQGKIQGRTDIPLNDTGRKQAALLAERLKKEDIAFEAVISSGLRRADETGAILANALNIPPLAPEPDWSSVLTARWKERRPRSGEALGR